MGCRRGEVLGPNIECITQITPRIGQVQGRSRKACRFKLFGDSYQRLYQNLIRWANADLCCWMFGRSQVLVRAFETDSNGGRWRQKRNSEGGVCAGSEKAAFLKSTGWMW